MPTALLLTLAILGTVLMGLFLAVSDSLLTRSPAGNGGEDLIFLSGPIASGTPRPTILLPSPTPTQSSTETISPAPAGSPTGTAIAMLPACPNRPADWLPRSVQAGDTAAGLAARAGISVNELFTANCLATEGLVPGMVIYLPPPVPAVEDCLPVPADWETYTVRAGDTLSALSRRYGVSVDQLQHVNCLPDAYLLAGEVIYVPPVVVVATHTPRPPRPTSTRPPRPTRTPRPSATPLGSPTPGLTATATPPGTAPPTQTPAPSPTGTPPTAVASPTPTSGAGTPDPSPTPAASATTPPPITGTPPSATPNPTTAVTTTPAATPTPAASATSAASSTPAATDPPPSPTSPPPTQPPPTQPPPTQPPPTNPPPTTQPPPTNTPNP